MGLHYMYIKDIEGDSTGLVPTSFVEQHRGYEFEPGDRIELEIDATGSGLRVIGRAPSPAVVDPAQA